MRLFFREEGNSDKVVIIIHGLFGSSDNWITIGRKLAATHHVYMIDQRNHGHSPHCETHSYEDMKEDLVIFCKEHNICKATFIGHSMGGKTAMAFAADYPELIENLVVIDIAPKNYLLVEEKRQHQLIIQTLRELNGNYADRKEIAAFINNRINDLDVTLFILKSIYRDKKTGKFTCRLNLDVLDKALNNIIGDIDENWFTGKLSGSYPVLFIRGGKSPYISDEDISMIRKIYTNPQIETIPHAGHWLHTEQPKQFLEVLQDFICS